MTSTSTTTRERPPETARITMDIPRDLHRRLRIRAAVEQTTMTALVVEVLTTVLPAGNADHTDRR